MVERPENRVVPVWQKTAFGIGGVGDTLMQNAVNNMANQVLNIFLGINPVLVSLAIFISRLWDAFSDPVIGSVSDNTRTRLGRRRPFMIIGGMGAACLFVVLWSFPFAQTDMGYFAWFLGCSLVFYTFYSLFSVPFNALGYELSPSYNERTRIMAFKFVFSTLAGLMIQWQFRFTQLERFENTLDGMKTVSVFIAGVILCTTLIPAILCRERLAREVAAQKKIRLFTSLKATFRNRSFSLLMLVLILCCLGMFMVTQLGIYINIYYIFEGDKRAASIMLGIAGTTYHLMGGIIASPIISYVAARIGKKRMLMIGLGMALIGAASKFFTYNPQWPYMQLASLALMSPGLACLWILTSSMVADICDEDELENGTRREGMFSAVYGYVMKIGISFGLLLTGFLLNATGFDARAGADQNPQAILYLRILQSAIPATALLLALFLIRRYSITTERAEQVRAELEKRHAQQSD
ncbi:MFS transporter [Pontiellaceae bacterium B12227]|nr:MFS transporter [Pontiellaceae bacterium B12227]